MSKLTYETKAPGNISVYLDKKPVGTIRRTKGLNFPEYVFFPKGSKNGGDKFSSLEACKESLK